MIAPNLFDNRHPGIIRLRLGTTEEITPVSVREEPVREEQLASMPEVAAPMIDPRDVRFRQGPRGCVVELPLMPEERIFGLGLQLKSLEQTTLKKTMRVNSDPVADTGDSHAPVPFYLSTSGYAVLVDTFRYASFYCGSHTPTAMEPKVMRDESGAIADTAEALYRRERAPRGPMLIDIPSARGVDIYIFSGPTMLDALRRYVLFSGGGCLPPMWGLGNWYRTYVRHTQDEALALAADLKDRAMPFSVFGLEPGWHAHAYACSFTWHPERFPDPEVFTDAITAMGYHLNLWEHVFTDASAPFYQELLPYSGNYRVWGGLVPDLFQKEARKLFQKHHEDAFLSKGVSGFKLDECDNSDFIVYPWSFPELSSFPSGADGEQMHSAFGLQFQRMMAALYRRRNQRTMGQVRSSHALAAPYPFVLYSDLYDHRDFLRGVCTAPLGGLLWSPEVRQCASPEDLVRRLQSVVLSPQSLINGWMIRNPPWKQMDKILNNAGAFMKGWEDLESRCRRILNWRLQLLPYMYAAFHQYATHGKPPFRPLVLDSPQDPETYRVDDCWMIGDDLLAAPLVAGDSSRNIYLPHTDGGWFDLNTADLLAGGQLINHECPLGRVPLFVRSGTLLPIARPVAQLNDETVFVLDIYAFGNALRPCFLIEDDFQTHAWESGDVNVVTLSARLIEGKLGDTRVLREGSFSKERYRIEKWIPAANGQVPDFSC